MKIRPVGVELFHAGKQTEGRTDRHEKKLSVAFRTLRTRQKLCVVTTQCIFVFCTNRRTNNLYTTLTD